MNITPIINAFIALVAAVITYFLIPYIRNRTTVQDREAICEWVRIAVLAAEQIYKSIPESGKLKKEYVIEFLLDHNFAIDEHELEVLIESEVFKLTEAFNDKIR